MNLEMKGGHMRFLDVDTCLSTKFQGGANQIQGGQMPPSAPPKINPGC